MIRYASTSTLCLAYEVSKDYFLRRKKSGEFMKNTHYVENSNTLRWNIKAIEEWWFGESLLSSDVDSILNRVIPN